MSKSCEDILFVLAFLILAGMFLPCITHQHHSGRARRTKCAGNLSSIGKSMSVYMLDEDKWPTSFSGFAPGYADNMRVFRCPYNEEAPGSVTNIEEWSDYTLVSNPGVGTAVWAFCKQGNHNNKGSNILYTDGSVQWFYIEEFEKEVREQNVKQNGGGK